MGAWNSSQNYSKGDLVTYNNKLYASIEDSNTNNQPSGTTADTAYWMYVVTQSIAAGADTEVQFNDGGVLGADNGFVFNKTTNALVVSGSVESPAFQVGNASDTTISRVSAGVIAVEGKPVVMTTGGQTVEFAAGSVGTPSITTTGDLNTGMWFPAADTLAWSTGGAERMRIDSNGRVGVGETSLNGTFEVVRTTPTVVSRSSSSTGSSSVIAARNDYYSGPSFASVVMQQYGSGAAGTTFGASNANLGLIQFTNVDNGIIGTNGGTPLILGTTNTERLRITSAGNVGVGTAAPDALLSVNGIASFGDGAVGTPSITNFGDLNTGMWFPAEDTIAFSEGGVESMRLNSSGFLGVGTSTIPAQVSIVGTGQAVTGTFDTAGSLGGSTLLGDAGGSVGNGGALVFSANSTNWRFAAIKGNVTSGASNSQGDLSFYVRNAAADANLTRAMVISPTGILGIGGLAAAGFTVTANRNLTGAASAGGFLSNGVIQSDATGIPTYFSATLSTAAGSYTVGNPQLFRAVGGSIGAGSAITNLYGYVAAALTAGTTNFNFNSGIVAADVTTGKTAFGYYEGSNAATGGGVTWAFYGAGTANSYFGGSVGIGSTSLTGSSLFVSRSLTGSVNSVGITSQGVIQSDVTTTAANYRSLAFTAAASFTLGAMYHYYAGQQTIGAGSAITSQSGFYSETNMIGATNNHGFFAANTAGVAAGRTASGFYSAVNIATGGGVTWGFFAGGTAWNYFASPVILDTNLWVDAPAPTVATGVATLTAAQIRTGIVSTTGTTYTLTLPTGTSIDSGFTGIPANVDVGFDVSFVNTASGTITIGVNTGVTSLGSLTIATGTSAMFRLRRTAANTYVVYRMA
jgi:hypothetical protein